MFLVSPLTVAEIAMAEQIPTNTIARRTATAELIDRNSVVKKSN